MGGSAGAALFQLAQGLDLWRFERDSEEYHRQSHIGIVSGLPMDFSFTDEQRLLKESVERLLADRYSFEARQRFMDEPTGWSRALWQSYAELGLLGLPFEDKHGGIGGGPVETMIVMEAFGRALALEPFFATGVLAGGLLRLRADRPMRAAVVPKNPRRGLLAGFRDAQRQSDQHPAGVGAP